MKFNTELCFQETNMFSVSKNKSYINTNLFSRNYTRAEYNPKHVGTLFVKPVFFTTISDKRVKSKDNVNKVKKQEAEIVSFFRCGFFYNL